MHIRLSTSRTDSKRVFPLTSASQPASALIAHFLMCSASLTFSPRPFLDVPAASCSALVL